MQIEILNQKSVTKTSTKGKPYTQLEVAYKNLSFGGKVEGKNIMSFGATEAAFKTIATAQAGEVYDIEVVKNAAGYNDWVSAKKSVAGTGQDTTATTSSTRSTGYSPASASPKSTYETPEERAKKQIYIVRQSSLATAERLLSVGAKQPPKVDEVIGIAKQLEGYVFGDEAKVDSGLPHDITDDIPE